MRSKAQVDGDVVALRDAKGPVLAPPAEVSIDSKATVAGDVFGERITLRSKAQVNGALHYNSLKAHKKAKIIGEHHAPLLLPLLRPLPFAGSDGGCGPDIVVPKKSTLRLEAGAYGIVTLKPGKKHKPTVLALEGGRYTMDKIKVKSWGRIECLTRCELVVAGKVAMSARSYMGPVNFSGNERSNIDVFVLGHNGKNGKLHAMPKAVTIGTKSTLHARLAVPNGTVWLRSKAHVRGVMVARDALVGFKAVVQEE